MATETFTIESPLAPAEAFARVADLSRVDEWDRGVQNPTQVVGDGPGLGSQYEVTVRGFDGQPSTVTYEFLEFNPPTRFVMVGLNNEIRAHDVIEVAATPTGSVLTYQAGLELLGENPPLSDNELDALFAKVVAIPREGLSRFLA